MDDSNTLHNRSSDAELESSGDLSNSIIGKMKNKVSKIFPTSLSKWLSPKVDMTVSRRRRHEELESDDEETNRNSTAAAPFPTSGNRYITDPHTSAQTSVPPNKKQKTLNNYSNQTIYNSYSSVATPQIGDRNCIASSTMIEDVPQRTSSQFNRYAPQENGQHTSARTLQPTANAKQDIHGLASNQLNPLKRGHHGSELNLDPDEASSSQSRDKPSNPFTVNNDSIAVNYSAHLQRAKSLFSNRSYVSPRLRNYRMRNPRSAIYRSTSSLCDNNSVSSNASSVMSSPFYNGQTTFGGACSTSKRLSNAYYPDMHLQQQQRTKIPTNLVNSKSTSSLNATNGTITSLSTTAKRILDLMSNYNTPLSDVRRVSNALPAISETSHAHKRKSLLDLDTSTAINEMEKTKRALMKPNTPYNRPFGRSTVEPIPTTELQVPSMSALLQLKKFATSTIQIRETANKAESQLNKPALNDIQLNRKLLNADRDLDATNNNCNNSKSDPILLGANAVSDRHKNKIRNNLTKRKMGKSNEDELPEPVNLPNITLNIDKNADLQFSTPLFKTAENKSPSIANNNGLQIPFSFKNSNAQFKSTSEPIHKDKSIVNGNDGAKKSVAVPSVSMQTTASLNASASSMNFSFINKTKTDAAAANSSFKFAEPIYVPGNAKFNNSDKSSFKFSEPIYVSENASRDSGIGRSFGFDKANAVSSSNSMFSGDKESVFNAAKTISTASTQLNSDDTFKAIVAKQKQGKWECSSCMVSNNAADSKCISCGTENRAKPSLGSADSVDTTKPVVDDVFKSIVEKQKQAKWECKSCMTKNDTSQPKCLCCGESQPNAAGIATPATTQPQLFVFGSQPIQQASSSVDSVFKSIADKQKSSKWECSACMTLNEVTKSKCICCDQSRELISSNTGTERKSTSLFSFGTKEKSSTSMTSTTTTSPFTFGASKTSTESTAAAATVTTASFSFGSKDTTAVSTTTAVPTATFSFGLNTTTSSTTMPQTTGFTFGSNAASSVSTSTSTAPTATFSFGSSAATSTSTAPKTSFSFGTSVTSSTATAPTPTFSFGSNAPSSTAAPAPTANFSFGSAAAKTTTLNTSGQFSFGRPSASTTTNESAKAETKDTTSTLAAPAGQFLFGSASPAATLATKTENTAAAAATEDVFKKIVSEQSAKWECKACMVKNDTSKDKCVSCDTPKNGSSANNSERKGFEMTSKSSFSFGAPNQSTFTFGSKPAAADASKPQSTFGSPPAFGSFAKPTTGTFQFGGSTAAPTTAAAATTAANAFTLNPAASTFSPSLTKPTETATKDPISTFAFKPPAASEDAKKQLGGFAFSFGAPSSTALAPKPTNEISKDVTDTGLSSSTSNKSINVLENVLVKPADAPKPMFSFGQALTPNQSPGMKRPSSESTTTPDNNLFKLSTPATNSAISGSPFAFGASSNNNLASPASSFNALGSNTANTPQTAATPSTVAKPIFGNAQSPSGSAFPAVQSTPSFSANPPAFSFGASNSTTPFGSASSTTPFGATNNATPAFGSPAPTLNTPSQPIFGSNAFSSSSMPTLGAKNDAATPLATPFGSTSAPVFGSPAPSFNTNQPATGQQQQPSSIFQFGGGDSNNVNSPFSTPKTETGGFSFTPGATPAFNFTQQTPQQQPNAPFQFGAPAQADASQNLFAIQPSANQAIQQRRKLKPVRRVRP